ncbi:MAG: LPS-assembly protein LptD [Desulfonatronovibrionaceae bacterium]
MPAAPSAHPSLALGLKILLFLALLTMILSESGLSARLGEEWNLEAGRIVSREDQNLVEAFDNVHLYQGDNFLQADYARLNTETRLLHLQGDIRAFLDQDYLQGEEADIDLQSRQGWIKNGRVFMADEHIYFSGALLEKTGRETYSFSQATVTSCDGESPPWSIFSSSGKITIGGYAALKHPRFRIKEQPVLYSPYAIIPVKTKRQSGFLLPELSYGSEYGTNINLPYYQVINEHMDATLYANYLSRRGMMLGLEYRHAPALLNKGLWRADWLHDRQRHDTLDSEPRRFRNDNLLRPNRDRYWLRAKYDGHHAPSGWSYKLDLDYVSDQNYLREFTDGHSGFKASRNRFLEEFGRDIQDRDSLTRTSILSAARYWKNAGLDARMVYSENLKYKNDNISSSLNPTLQRLPEINFNLFRTPLGSSSLEVEGSSQAVYFWREYGTRAGRIDLHPRISLPLDLPRVTLTPSMGYRQTVWMVDRFENHPDSGDTDHDFQTRGLLDFELNAYSNLSRVFTLNRPLEVTEANAGRSRRTKIRHSIRPEIDFRYVSDKNQDKYPLFDSLDRISPREELTYTLGNTFTSRTDSVSLDMNSGRPAAATAYHDFFRIKLEQSFDFREARRNTELDLYPRRPFSDIMAEAEFNPGQYISLSSKTWYSPYENRITEHEHSLTLDWPDKASTWFSLDFLDKIHEFKRRINQEISIAETGLSLNFLENWKAAFIYRRDLDRDKTLEQGLNITYRHQCYSLEFNFTETDYDRRFEARVNLLNLGTFGG